jgi:hypothetical protein
MRSQGVPCRQPAVWPDGHAGRYALTRCMHAWPAAPITGAVDGSVAGQWPAAHRGPLPHYFSRAVHPLSAGLLVALAWPLWQRRAGSYASAARIIAEHLAGGAASVGGFAQATLRGVMSLVPKSVTAPVLRASPKIEWYPGARRVRRGYRSGALYGTCSMRRTKPTGGLAERGFALGTVTVWQPRCIMKMQGLPGWRWVCRWCSFTSAAGCVVVGSTCRPSQTCGPGVRRPAVRGVMGLPLAWQA